MALRTTQQHVSVLAPGGGSLRTTQQHVSVLAPGDGNLRTTQQHISVLAPGDGKLRVTNQYVEVIGRVSGSIRVTNQYIEILAQVNPQGSSDIGISHSVSILVEQTFKATSDIGISQELFISPYVVDVISNIDIDQELHQPIDVSPEVEHSIGVGQSVAHTIKYDINVCENTINLIQFADGNTFGRASDNTLNVTHSATGTKADIYRRDIITTIDFEQSVNLRGNFYVVEVWSNLLTGRFETQPVYDEDGNQTGWEQVWVQTGLSQEVSISGDYSDFDDGHHIGITDTVSYIHTPAGGTSKSAESNISLTHSVFDSLGVDSSIIITQIAVGLESTGADYGIIDVSHSVSYSIEGERASTHTIGITHGVGYYVVEDAFCDYRISIGESTEADLPSEPSEPSITEVDQISFTFPTGGGTTLYFNKPEWGNIHETYQRRIDRQSRGGKRIIYHDSSWREHEIIKITLISLTEAQTMNLLTFFNNSAGDKVKYIDHESREWEVIILNPDEQIVRDGVSCDNTVSIEMETI